MNTAVVTGAGRGIGRETARRLAARGYQVLVTDLNEAIRLDTKLGPAFLGRGKAWVVRKEYDKALSDLESALTKGCEPLAGHYMLARVYQALGRRAEALASVRRALEVNPQHAESRELLANLESKSHP